MIDFDLHKLGWRAFQDLCAVVLQQVLGQTFHTFADSNDVGRDGAFHGFWSTPVSTDVPLLAAAGPTVAQCKFSARRDGTLSPSALAEEVEKARALHRAGRCDAYILLTNLRVTGRTESAIADQLAAVGIPNTLVLDGRWICQQITRSSTLRRYVPRVYGLGDLGMILDDRKLRQAQTLLSRLREDLSTFVPTNAYRRAARAVHDHRFAVLLGEPAAGKSTIAAVVALTALDEWGSRVRRVDSAAELVAGWDPDDPDQLFWIDDAFGGIRHDPALTDGWIRRMDQVTAAVSQGCRVLLTSRDYIYREASIYLKEYNHPLLRDQKVVIDVAELTLNERQQILYNHLKAGDQAEQTLATWRPNLQAAAAVHRFQPEVARRLSFRAFTNSAPLQTEQQLIDYFKRPIPFLADVLRQLSPATQGALACVYMTGDQLPAPVEMTDALAEAVARLGTSPPEVMRAFQAVEGIFLQTSVTSDGGTAWRFRHPTIREGFAAVVAEDANAVGIFVDGLSDGELLRQVDCGGPDPRGTVVRVPPALYRRVLPRVPVPTRWDHFAPGLNVVASFLLERSSPEFLRSWTELNLEHLAPLTRFSMYINACWEPKLLARMHQIGALPEGLRRKTIETLSSHALEFDAGWLDEPVCGLFSDSERDDLLAAIKQDIIPYLEQLIDHSATGWEETSYSESFNVAKHAIQNYLEAFADDSDTTDKLQAASDYIEQRIAGGDSYEPFEYPTVPPPDVFGQYSQSDESWPLPIVERRDPFDDVTEGR